MCRTASVPSISEFATIGRLFTSVGIAPFRYLFLFSQPHLRKGFDKSGEECYWNVSGDNVSAISLIDIEEEETMLIVGSDDNSIRLYKGEEIFLEIAEAAKPICLVGLYSDKFALILACSLLLKSL